MLFIHNFPFKLIFILYYTITINSNILKINTNTNTKHIKHPIIVGTSTSILFFKLSLLIKIKVSIAATTAESIIPNDSNQNNLLNFKGSFNDFKRLYCL